VDERSITWRAPRTDEFWRQIPAWRKIERTTFLEHRWQERNAVTSAGGLIRLLGEQIAADFAADLEEGMRRSPMSVRLAPYIVALIDWTNPVEDPLRRQFLPLASRLEEDHPLVGLDTLAEKEDAPVAGLTHRYFDKALFLVTDVCPVYCRYCTRSYAVGLDTEEVQKVKVGQDRQRWERCLEYIEQRHELEDIVVSGGDVFRLKGEQLSFLGERLLAIDHVRRIRFATKGLAVQPMKILSDGEWIDAVTAVANKGRALHKDVSIHTHFNHPNEITSITQQALNAIFERSIPVRNLCVLLRGVNDDAAVQIELNRRLAFLNIRPYYTYAGDLVQGTEDLRISVDESLRIEKVVRGTLAGHNTPTYVMDAPGGGGKRDLYSYEHYDRETGISVYTAPSVKPDRQFLYVDPLRYLSEEMRERWRRPESRRELIEDALASARVKSQG
jgi:lysine 2,3-aminomutase